MDNIALPKIAITSGDLNGIGMELIMKVLDNEYILKYCIPILYANPRPLAFLKKQYEIQDFNYTIVGSAKEAKEGRINLVVCNDDEFRVELATEHVSVDKITEKLTTELLVNKINSVYKSLREDFLITRPRIAVLGLNPHAGDSGTIGKHEIDIIKPAIQQVFEKDVLVFGPYAADSYFSGKNVKGFDAVIAMYHDQGLIPFKSVAFYDGVNYTAGLPLVRTSPDHGTAYDIAGKNEASITSFQNAIHEAIKICKNRIQYHLDYENPLAFEELKRERFRINF
jgi:4-hydroxy-L-threonine phosphate dehydrogenase PdxA